MSTYISDILRKLILNNDRRRCCYCLTSEANSGIPMTYDHIKPLSKRGRTNFENLCLACRSCNEFKSDSTKAVDPLTGETILIFNPRTQIWSEHFTWSPDSTKVKAITAIGTTIITLRMNNLVIVVARRRWTVNGWHPPVD